MMKNDYKLNFYQRQKYQCLKSMRQKIISNKYQKVLKIEIFKYLSLSQLINVRLVNKYLSDLIRGHKWDHLIVGLRDKDKIKSVVKNFNFLKYDFSFSNITDDIVKELRGCHTLYLSYCQKITDETVLTTFGIKSCVVVILSIFIIVRK